MKRRNFLTGLTALPLLGHVKVEAPVNKTYRDEFIAGFNKARFSAPVVVRDGAIEHKYNFPIHNSTKVRIYRA